VREGEGVSIREIESKRERGSPVTLSKKPMRVEVRIHERVASL
jgi:hypothetical protein